MKRYHVRADGKTWGEKGPDLLRTSGSAVKQVHELGEPAATSKRQHDGTWSEPKALDRDLPQRLAYLRGGDVLRIENKNGQPVAFVKAAEFLIQEFSGATARAELVNALMTQGDPSSEFAGIYVCKQIAGTNPPVYSDHAWGDAVDRSNGHNDLLFDFVVRMARAGLMEVAYVIGSQGGKVVSADAPDYAVNAGGGDSTHLWHVHVSVVKHSGRPPCA
jgi:hypothetical protein